ncbi:MAG: type II secretion system protein, partial [Planctomycetes bacterium]|nr:type II secretion system protein [Planctomycetota bacterium]
MPPRHHLSRRGFSLLELQVAFVVLAIALAGLYPLVVIHSKQQRKLEQRLDPQTTYYLVPS